MRAVRRRDRRGYSLIELLVAMTVGAVLMTLGAGLIRNLMRLDRGGRALIADDARLDRLAHAFRDDAHAATAVARAAPDRLSMTLAEGRSVEYRIDGGVVVRSRRGGEAEDIEDHFKLPAKGDARLSVREEGPRTIVGLTVSRRPGRVASSGLRAEAVLGRARRFAGEGAK